LGGNWLFKLSKAALDFDLEAYAVRHATETLTSFLSLASRSRGASRLWEWRDADG